MNQPVSQINSRPKSTFGRVLDAIVASRHREAEARLAGFLDRRGIAKR